MHTQRNKTRNLVKFEKHQQQFVLSSLHAHTFNHPDMIYSLLNNNDQGSSIIWAEVINQRLIQL